MSLPYILMDFENVQPKMLERLRPGSFRVKVFLGQHQSKLMLDLVQKLQPFGSDAEYIQIQGSGPDAVDFHIAFYIGQLAAAEPSTHYVIVSKDKGFDPLVRHLALRGITCRRVPELPEPPAPKAPPLPTPKPGPKPAAADAKPAPARSATKTPTPVVSTDAAMKKGDAAPTTARARAKAVMEHLKKSTKPATVATLRSAIKPTSRLHSMTRPSMRFCRASRTANW